MLDSGWLKLDYSVDPAVATNLVGVAFDYPEEKMLKKTWLGDGPYRVWRNRLKGQTFGVWETGYNTTETGYKDWVYPEFAGYFANVRWLKLTTTEGTLTLMIPDEKTFVRVGTPKFPPVKLAGKTVVTNAAGQPGHTARHSTHGQQICDRGPEWAGSQHAARKRAVSRHSLFSF